MQSHLVNSFDPNDPSIYRVTNQTFLVNQKTITVDILREIIFPFLKVHPEIKTLNFYKNNLGAEGAKLLAAFLQSNTTITSLIIIDNHIDDEGAIALASLLTLNKTLQKINLPLNQIGEIGTKALAQAIQNNSSLIDFNLASNPISDEGALALYHAKRSAKNLQEFIIDDDYVYLSDENINALLSEAQRNFDVDCDAKFKYDSKEQIKGITFRHAITNYHVEVERATPLNPDIVMHILIPYFNAHPEMTALHFNYVEVDAETIYALILLIQSCKTIKSIKMFDLHASYSYRPIFALKAAAKAHSVALSLPTHYLDVDNGDDLLKRNKSNEPNTLDLSCSGYRSNIEWDGYIGINSQDIIELIIPHLQIHPDITILRLDKNRNITDGIIALVNAGVNLTTLSVHECYIPAEGLQALAKLNKFVQLEISGNYTTDHDLAMIVKNNPQLRLLRARYNTVGRRQYFAEAVKVIAKSKIKELNFNYHQLGTEQIKHLAQSKTIKKLNLHNNGLTDECLLELAKNNVILSLNLSSNIFLTDAGLQKYLVANKSLISLNLKWDERIGDLTAIAIAQHPTLQKVNLEYCYKISEAGIRALSASPNLKKIKYSGYDWDNAEFIPLLARENPHERTSLPQVKVSIFNDKVDQVALNNLFKVPTLFSLAGFSAKEQAIKEMQEQFTLEYMISPLQMANMKPNQMKQKRIYLCHFNPQSYKKGCNKSGYQYKLIEEECEVKRGIIYEQDLSSNFRFKSAAFLINHPKKFLLELLKHIINNGHISLLSKKKTGKVSRDVQLAISKFKF